MKKEDVDKMTLQEAMDYSINKLVKQGRRCRIENECAYGNSKGQHCAVGWLLDEDNDGLMNAEGGIYVLMTDHRAALPKLILENEAAFIEFQKFHDFESFGSRSRYLLEIEGYGIDVDTNRNWKKWLEMCK
jgi:hypothetical protein